jgi:signal transduction histidine kinase
MPQLQSQSETAFELTPETLARLHAVPILASLDEEKLHCLDGATYRRLKKDELLVGQGELTHKFWILMQGSLRLSAKDNGGREQSLFDMQPGGSFGEIPLVANMAAPASMRALEPAELLELSEEHFWRLMTVCPEVRREILGNMARRLAKAQNATFQQEKMAALGTLAAGLMHELNNPGAAARRAAATLRENLLRLHRLSGRFSRRTMADAEKACLLDLQEYALTARPAVTLSTIEQTDAEEALAAWMESHEVEDAWRLAPTFIAIGMNAEALECAAQTFPHDLFSDCLNWLEALLSSQHLVSVIEESVGRVTDLVHAVKSYAYEGRGQRQQLDLNRSIHATLVILGHKMREKEIVLAKDLDPTLPPLETECQGLNQVWTNLIDNAIDAVAPHGHVYVKTWCEELATGAAAHPEKRRDLCILIGDDGPGIPPEAQPHIFDPFFTTKPVGVGTGLGLGIVYRIVEQCGGVIRFASVPGHTEFIVRIPTALDSLPADNLIACTDDGK